GKEYTPKTWLSDYLNININDYFSFMSTMQYSYNEKHELVEDDNWFHSDDYYNVSLSDFMSIINNALQFGASICICGDVSEPGYSASEEVAIVPDFDIPSKYINESARQKRLSDGSTTDDHCVHIVGYQKVNSEYWYLIKDSGSGAFDGKNKGYRFYHEDYVKLKMMNIMVYKEAGRKVLDRIIK
ncbi:MAG: peptidase C1, partial [Bacteroidales bacterium]|nr:peptidase C1 [Bacteroidales bacterium]